jgi:hypothetical protein
VAPGNDHEPQADRSGTRAQEVGSIPESLFAKMVYAVLILVVGSFCVASFRLRLNWAAKALVTAMLLLMLFLTFKGTNGNRASGRDAMLDEFAASINGATNFQSVVIWARKLLAQTNDFKGGFRTKIDREELPDQLFGLYKGFNSEVAQPLGSIWHSQMNGDFVAINYYPGGVFRFAIFIGREDFAIPVGSVKKWRKLEDGAYVVLDWP